MFEFSEPMRRILAISGDEIRAAREKFGLSQKELAMRSGVKLESIEKIEAGIIMADWSKQQVMIFLGFIKDDDDSGTRH